MKVTILLSFQVHRLSYYITFTAQKNTNATKTNTHAIEAKTKRIILHSDHLALSKITYSIVE